MNKQIRQEVETAVSDFLHMLGESKRLSDQLPYEIMHRYLVLYKPYNELILLIRDMLDTATQPKPTMKSVSGKIEKLMEFVVNNNLLPAGQTRYPSAELDAKEIFDILKSRAKAVKKTAREALNDSVVSDQP